jgi:hypothetical protein
VRVLQFVLYADKTDKVDIPGYFGEIVKRKKMVRMVHPSRKLPVK